MPVYKCSECGKVFVEWTVNGEKGTPWYFISKAMKGELGVNHLRAELICPNCGAELGSVVWMRRNPHILFNYGVKAEVVTLPYVTDEEAVDALKVAERAKDLLGGGEVVVWQEKMGKREEGVSDD